MGRNDFLPEKTAEPGTIACNRTAAILVSDGIACNRGAANIIDRRAGIYLIACLVMMTWLCLPQLVRAQATSSIKVENKAQSSATPTTQASSSTIPTATSPKTAVEITPEWHKLGMRLSGSSCTSCLKDLERKIAALTGVKSAKVLPPEQTYHSYEAPLTLQTSSAEIVFDANAVSADSLKIFLKQKGYYPFKVRESKQ